MLQGLVSRTLGSHEGSTVARSVSRSSGAEFESDIFGNEAHGSKASPIGETSVIIQPAHISYAQRAWREELWACRKQSEIARSRVAAMGTLRQTHVSVRDMIWLDLSSAGQSVRELTPRSRAHIPLPHRNLPLLSFAMSAACAVRNALDEETGLPANTRNADPLLTDVELYIATSSDDAGWYPSAGPDFVAMFSEVVTLLDERVRVVAPLRDLSKTPIVEEGQRIGVDWGATYSCMLGDNAWSRGHEEASAARPKHCGRCPQCRARRAAFEAVGIVDP